MKRSGSLLTICFSMLMVAGAGACGTGEGGEEKPVDVGKADAGTPVASKDGGATGGLNCKNLAEVEQKLIVPTCGKGGCHDGTSPPLLNKVGDIVPRLLDKPGMNLCKSDRYIDKANVIKSYVLAKVAATSVLVTCPSGGSAGSGGTRMPSDMAFTAEQVECFRTYVTEAAK